MDLLPPYSLLCGLATRKTSVVAPCLASDESKRVNPSTCGIFAAILDPSWRSIPPPREKRVPYRFACSLFAWGSLSTAGGPTDASFRAGWRPPQPNRSWRSAGHRRAPGRRAAMPSGCSSTFARQPRDSAALAKLVTWHSKNTHRRARSVAQAVSADPNSGSAVFVSHLRNYAGPALR